MTGRTTSQDHKRETSGGGVRTAALNTHENAEVDGNPIRVRSPAVRAFRVGLFIIRGNESHRDVSKRCGRVQQGGDERSGQQNSEQKGGIETHSNGLQFGMHKHPEARETKGLDQLAFPLRSCARQKHLAQSILPRERKATSLKFDTSLLRRFVSAAKKVFRTVLLTVSL